MTNDVNSNGRFYPEHVQESYCGSVTEHDNFMKRLRQHAKDYIWVIYFFLAICFINCLSIVHLVYSPDGELEEFFFRKVAELDEYLPKGYSVTFLLYADPYTKGAIVFCVSLYLTVVYLTYRRENS